MVEWRYVVVNRWMICKSLAVHRIFLLQHGLAQAQSWPIAKQVGPLRSSATLQPGQNICMQCNSQRSWRLE